MYFLGCSEVGVGSWKAIPTSAVLKEEPIMHAHPFRRLTAVARAAAQVLRRHLLAATPIGVGCAALARARGGVRKRPPVRLRPDSTSPGGFTKSNRRLSTQGPVSQSSSISPVLAGAAGLDLPGSAIGGAEDPACVQYIDRGIGPPCGYSAARIASLSDEELARLIARGGR